MQGASGMSKDPEQCEAKGEKLQDDPHDSCSSPPQKRLKQAHIPFKASSPSLILNGQPKAGKTASTPERVDNNKKISAFFETKNDSPSQGTTRAKAISPDNKRIKLDNNLNEVSEKSPDKATDKADDEVVEVQEDSCVTPVQNTLNTSTSSVESSPECLSNSEDYPQVISVTTPTNSKLPTKVAKSSERLKREAEKKAKREEREAQRLEKRKLKEIQEKEKQEARAKKEQERLEVKRKREMEQQIKKEEREKKEKERLERKMVEDKEREDKNKRKEEEKKRKEEERLAKLEEKNKKEEERKQIEEEELRRKQKAQTMFKSFFKPLAMTPKQVPPTPKNTFEQRFQPFVVSKDMEMAPLTRRSQIDEQFRTAVDNSMKTQNYSSNYVQDIKGHQRKNQFNKKSETHESANKNGDCEILITLIKEVDPKDTAVITESPEQAKPKRTYKAKLLQFHSNTRPPYYGTWRKRSKVIKPRNPLTKDKDLLDYDVDSDEEWEEEDPGESISHSEGEEEGGEDNNDDDDDDDGFFVPHGYLSDDEGVGAEEEEEEGEEKSGLKFDPERKREQLIKKGRAWEAELERKCRPMKPVVIGCALAHGENVSSRLLQYKVCNIVESPIEISSSVPKDLPGESTDTSPMPRHPMAMYVPEEAMPELIRMLHGSTAGLMKLVKMFRKHWALKNKECADGPDPESTCSISKRQLERKISEIATKERRPSLYYKACWYVHEKILNQYGLQDLTIQNRSSLSPLEETSLTPKSVTPTPPTASPQTSSILQFTKTASPACIRPLVKNATPVNAGRQSPGVAMEMDNSAKSSTTELNTTDKNTTEQEGKENSHTT